MTMRERVVACIAALAVLVGVVAGPASPAVADGPTLHSAGSTWVQIALTQWASDVARFGLNVDYQGIGSTAGRQNYMYNLIDFAATEIPYQPDELAQYHAELGGRFRSYQYLPDVAGGTAFMYNLIDPATGQRITNLRLSEGTIAKIFTGHVDRWRDPAILADNPGLNIPDNPLIPVSRSDSSGTSGQLSLYLAASAPDLWRPFEASIGCPPPCANWRTDRPFVGQSLSSGVTNYVSSTPNTINYVEAGYALAKGLPVAYVGNASGNYALPLSGNVQTALTHARLHPDLTQDLSGVYVAPEPNAYPLSSYSYLITPTDQIDPAKGHVLGQFLLYVACAGQQAAPLLGYSPLPKNLVQVVFDAINRINGHPPTPDLSTPQGVLDCPNPSFSSGSGFGAAARAGGAAGTRSGARGNAGPAAGSNQSNLAQDGTGVLDKSSAAKNLSPKERAARLLASRRTAAFGAVRHVRPQTDAALRWAALYLPILVFGPLLLRRKRRLEIRRAS